MFEIINVATTCDSEPGSKARFVSYVGGTRICQATLRPCLDWPQLRLLSTKPMNRTADTDGAEFMVRLMPDRFAII